MIHKTPLHYAVEQAANPEVDATHDLVPLVECLLSYGAHPVAKDNNGRTPADLVRGARCPSERKDRLMSLLESYASQPLSLQRYCQLAIRRQFPVRSKETGVTLLPISQRLKHQLDMSE